MNRNSQTSDFINKTIKYLSFKTNKLLISKVKESAILAVLLVNLTAHSSSYLINNDLEAFDIRAGNKVRIP